MKRDADGAPANGAAGSAVYVTVEIEPDRVSDFLKAMETDATGSRDKALDPGCLRFDLLRDRENPNKFVFYECYTDDDAAAHHKTTAHYKAWADFKAAGGVKSQEVVKLSSATIPGSWAFQCGAGGCEGSSTSSAVLVTVDIKPDRIDDFLIAMEADVTKSRSKAEDPGCMRFDLMRCRDDSNRFVFYEAYSDDDAAAHHKTTAHYKAWADFKASGGVVAQSVVKLETASIPGAWAFQPAVAPFPVGSAVLVNIEILPDRIDDFLKAMEVDVIGSRDKRLDPGCVRFDLLRDREDPNKFSFYEAYVDDDAAAHHKTTAHYKAWADFKASGGVKSQDVLKLDTTSIPGSWAFQCGPGACSAPSTSSAVFVTVDIKPDRVDDFLAAMAVDVTRSRDKALDAGCMRFDLLRGREDPNRFVFYEAYVDDDAAAHHKTTAHYKAWADFKASGGVASQTAQKVETASIPGQWAFQRPALAVPTVKLGCVEMPLLGFGTYKVGAVPASASGATAGAAPPSGPAVVDQIVKDALVLGYPMLDCAQFYANEHWIGGATKKMGARREDVFYISKVWTDTIYAGADAVKAQVDKTISELQCGYLDMCLIHWPVPGKHVAAFNALRECKAAGKVKEVGVSNYCVEDFEELKEAGAYGPDEVDKPKMNQIEVNPLLFRKKTLDYCRKEGVHVQSYRGLMQNPVKAASSCPELKKVCDETGRPPSQVLGRFLVQQGISHVPKASVPERMQENAGIFTFQLTPAQMESLSGLTQPPALQAFKELYTKCIWRDTPEAGSALPGDRTLD